MPKYIFKRVDSVLLSSDKARGPRKSSLRSRGPPKIVREHKRAIGRVTPPDIHVFKPRSKHARILGSTSPRRTRIDENPLGFLCSLESCTGYARRPYCARLGNLSNVRVDCPPQNNDVVYDADLSTG